MFAEVEGPQLLGMLSHVGKNSLPLLGASGATSILGTKLWPNRRHSLEDIRPAVFDGWKAYIPGLRCGVVVHSAIRSAMRCFNSLIS
jgi:hypothetical protein